MTFSLLIIGIIFSAITCLVTLILSIIYLASGKSRNGLIAGVTFVMSIIVLVLCITEAIRKGSHKIKEGVEWMQKQEHRNNDWNANARDADYYAFIPEGITDSIAPGFYDSRDQQKRCIPLVYPYRFVSTDAEIVGFCSLENYSGKADSCLKELQHISHFAFNDKLLLVKRDNNEMLRVSGDRQSDLPENTYFIFNLTTGKCRSFMNEDRMFEEARKQGYDGSKSMSSNYSHYWNYASFDEE